MQHRQKEETVVMVLGCSQRVQVSRWEEIWWNVYTESHDQWSMLKPVSFFYKVPVLRRIFCSGDFSCYASTGELMWQVESFQQKVYLRVIQVSDKTFSLNHNQVSAWGQSGLGTSSQEWVRGGCHLPAPDWHRSPAGDQIHGRRENDPEQIGFMEHVWQ